MRQILDVGFEPDGTVLITFFDPSDIRCQGTVAVRKTARIEPSEQYAEGVHIVELAVKALLRDALGDWEVSEPADLGDPAGDAGQRSLPAEESAQAELDEATAARNWEAIEAARPSATPVQCTTPRCIRLAPHPGEVCVDGYGGAV